ncbi:hypothetical protein ISCGN_003129 [Ixodes scapularis]
MLSASWKVTVEEVIKNCFGKAGFEAPAASAREEVDREETNGGASSSSSTPRESERDESQEALLEEDEQDQEALWGAWQFVHSDGGIPYGVALEAFLFGDSCVVVMEEVTDDSIVKEVLGESEDDDCEADAEDPYEVPSSREVLNASDVLGWYPSAHEQQDAMHALWAFKRRTTPIVMSQKPQSSVVLSIRTMVLRSLPQQVKVLAYLQEQQDLVRQLEDQVVDITTDGRFDSPGFSAKLLTYTAHVEQINKILHSIQVQLGEDSLNIAMPSTQPAI